MSAGQRGAGRGSEDRGGRGAEPGPAAARPEPSTADPQPARDRARPGNRAAHRARAALAVCGRQGRDPAAATADPAGDRIQPGARRRRRALDAARGALGRDLSADLRYPWPLFAAAMRAYADTRAGGHGRDPGQLATLREALRPRGPPRRQSPAPQAHAPVVSAEAARADGEQDLGAWDQAGGVEEAASQPNRLAYALARRRRRCRRGRAPRRGRRLGLTRSRYSNRSASSLGGPASSSRSGGGEDAAHTAAPFGLTARELEMLRLVTAGRCNREIAAKLFISPRTASVHVSNILAKLGAGHAARRRPPRGGGTWSTSCASSPPRWSPTRPRRPAPERHNKHPKPLTRLNS